MVIIGLVKKKGLVKMITEFGKQLRKIRIDNSEVLKDMADRLKVTSSYLSAVETGKRSIPEDWVVKITSLYNLNNIQQEELIHLADQAAKSIKLKVDGYSANKIETALVFARAFDSMDEDTASKIKNFISKKDSVEGT
jgi:HTH-type transcriptional regulator, competence development regulator